MKYFLTNEKGDVLLELDDSKKNLGIKDSDTTPTKDFAWKSMTGGFIVYNK
jgi:hypothetical protein